MKRTATLLAAAALMCALPATVGFKASAQSDAPQHIQKASVFYDLTTLYPKGADNSYFNGFGLGYNIDFRVSDALPLYVGTGLDLRFLFNNETIIDADNYNPLEVKTKTRFINLNLPVNVSYRVPVAQGFYLTPQLGLDLRAQLDGRLQTNASVAGPESFGLYSTTTQNDYNLFSKDDMGDAHYRRFQFGWHAALNFEYNRFNLGLSYGTDFVKLHKNLGAGHFLVSLGYVF
ncbi:MAG: outer membrane beta-barrel protein [Muribaculaceae bacterium]|nr:outer membrane beta-barrel protein [Muribaculaceae bacterium]